jgi:phosphoribulokinase
MSHFSPAANHLDKLAALFEEYGEYGTGSHRQYIHDEEDALQNGGQIGSFTPWSPLAADTDLIVYEGLHGCFKSDAIDIAQHVDLKVGVTPIVNLEWMQKVHRDTHMRGYSQEAVADTIQRRLSDYVRYITPQFSQTDINFQRIPMVDTSNPFEHQPLPGLDESKLVVRFRHPAKMPYSFPELLGKIPDAFMSRRNSIVIPGSEFELALQLILEPLISRLLDSRG